MKNGEVRTVEGIKIEAVPAYNIVHMRSEGVPFHAKGSGNGYVVTLGGKRIYVAGDTENIPEMSELGTIDCAFLPMNLPYTMTPKWWPKQQKNQTEDPLPLSLRQHGYRPARGPAQGREGDRDTDEKNAVGAMREMMGREPGSSGLRVRRLILSFVVPALLLPLVVFSSCEDSGSNPSRDAVLQGQVFLISKPGPIPIGWVPPPLETVNTLLF